MNEWSHPDADRVRKELCEADDTISAAVERVIRAEARAEAHASRSVKAEAAQAVLESCIGVRGHVLLAYGDTFAQIAGLLAVPRAVTGLARFLEWLADGGIVLSYWNPDRGELMPILYASGDLEANYRLRMPVVDGTKVKRAT
jgi:hypothetical protein